MSLFQKASTRQSKLKIFVYGGYKTGKTMFGLSFSKAGRVAVIDTEGGTNLFGDLYDFDSLHAKDYGTVMQAIEEIKKDNGKTWQTVIIDPITVIWEMLQDAGIRLADARAKRNQQQGVIIDVVLTQRDWGILKRHYTQLMTMLIGLPVHVIIIARQKDITDSNGNKIGVTFDTEKRTAYIPDIILRLVNENGKYKAIVEGDRSRTYKVGQTIENPSYDAFAAIAERISTGAPTISQDDNQAAQATAKVLEQEFLSMPQGTPSPALPSVPSQSPAANSEAMVTDRQQTSIHKLCTALGRSEPDYRTLTFIAARELLTQLSMAYSESRQGEVENNAKKKPEPPATAHPKADPPSAQNITVQTLHAEVVKLAQAIGITPTWIEQSMDKWKETKQKDIAAYTLIRDKLKAPQSACDLWGSFHLLSGPVVQEYLRRQKSTVDNLYKALQSGEEGRGDILAAIRELIKEQTAATA